MGKLEVITQVGVIIAEGVRAVEERGTHVQEAKILSRGRSWQGGNTLVIGDGPTPAIEPLRQLCHGLLVLGLLRKGIHRSGPSLEFIEAFLKSLMLISHALVRFQLRLQMLLEALCDWLSRHGIHRSFQLDKVHPDARARAGAGFVPSLAEHRILGLACVRAFVADREVAVAARIDLDGNLQRLRIRERASDLMRAEHVEVCRIGLAGADLDEAAFFGRFVRGGKADAQCVFARRPFFGGGNAGVATEAVKHEPSAGVACGELGIVGVILMMVGVFAAGELRVIDIAEAELRGLR